MGDIVEPGYFTSDELDYIGVHCAKLHPEAQIYNNNQKIDFILFKKHELCVIKHREKFLLCQYLGEKEDTVLGETITVPVKNIEEVVFAILAIATSRLPSHLANKLVYENRPITYQ